MQREGGAAGTVERERLLAQFRGNLVKPVDKAALPELTVELVHGRMKAKDKAARMARFSSGEAQLSL